MTDSTPLSVEHCVAAIARRVGVWLERSAPFQPSLVERHRGHAGSARELLRALLGAFMLPTLPAASRLIVFEGLRHREHHMDFRRGDVVILGSRAERDYARANGYAFVWSFPMSAAVNVMLSRGAGLFLQMQVRRWAKRLRTYGAVGIFLYEDTQPLGSFLAHVARTAGRHVKVVCVQHGYFPRTDTDRPIDGSASEINFVWDRLQASLIGCDPGRAIVIGPPVTARSRGTVRPNVVFVGTGALYDGTDHYQRSLAWYVAVLEQLPEDLRARACYRPHPNEFVDPSVTVRLRQMFPRLDVAPLAERLGGAASVFVGSTSSLLYEARMAGHMVGHVALHRHVTPTFERHRDFAEHATAEAAAWLRHVCLDGHFVHQVPQIERELSFRAAAEKILAQDGSR